VITNLYVLFLAIGKAAWMTGLGPAVLFLYAAQKLVSAFGVPAHHQGERWLVWKINSSARKVGRKFTVRSPQSSSRFSLGRSRSSASMAARSTMLSAGPKEKSKSSINLSPVAKIPSWLRSSMKRCSGSTSENAQEKAAELKAQTKPRFAWERVWKYKFRAGQFALVRVQRMPEHGRTRPVRKIRSAA
jgi:hypothetical protein